MKFIIKGISLLQLEQIRELADEIDIIEYDDGTFEVKFEYEETDDIGEILLDYEYAEIDLSSLAEGFLEIYVEEV